MKRLISICTFIFLVSLGFSQVDKQKSVSFDLLNKSAKSIPLVIEGVMKPNLSPFSRSGVSCKIGTRIWTKGRKDLLLVVTEDLKGQQVIVNKLINEMKQKKDE